MPPRDYDFKLWARANLARIVRDDPLPSRSVPRKAMHGCIYCGVPLPPHRAAMTPRTCANHADLPALDLAGLA